MAAGRVAQAPRAGESLHATYEQRHADWIRRRRRGIWLSAVWWGPALVAAAIGVGSVLRFPAFGVIFLVLSAAAVIDVAFSRPDSLVLVKTRATAETATGRLLRHVEIRGGASVLHDRMLTGAADPFAVEHLVVSPRGIFLVDTKQWAGHSVRLLGRDLFLDNVDQGAVFKQLAEHARVLGETLTAAAGADEEVGVVTVTPLLALHGTEIRATPLTIHNVVLLTPEQLPGILRRPDLRWSPSAVNSLTAAAELLLIRKDPEPLNRGA
jgi:hypothetical protein